MSTEIQKYETEQKQARDLQVMVEGLDITNEQDFKDGISLVVLAKRCELALEASELGEAKQKAHELHKQVTKVYKAVSEGIEVAKTVCLDKMKGYLEGRKTDPEDDRLSYRENWSAEVYDIKALCQDIVDGKVASDCVKPNATLLNSLARSSKEFLRVGGVRAVSKKVLVFKSKDEA